MQARFSSSVFVIIHGLVLCGIFALLNTASALAEEITQPISANSAGSISSPLTIPPGTSFNLIFDTVSVNGQVFIEGTNFNESLSASQGTISGGPYQVVLEPGDHTLTEIYSGAVNSSNSLLGNPSADIPPIRFERTISVDSTAIYTIEPHTTVKDLKPHMEGPLTVSEDLIPGVVGSEISLTLTVTDFLQQNELIEYVSGFDAIAASNTIIGIIPIGIAETSTSIAFGTVVVDKAHPFNLPISNVGGADLTVTNITSDLGGILSMASTAFTVAPGTTRAVSLTLNPVATGEIHGTLTVESDSPISPTVIPITATAQIPEPEPEPEPGPEPQPELEPTIEVTPSPITFGDVTVDQTASITVTIDNTGDADLNVANITSDLGGILTISSTVLTVASGTTRSITLTFTAAVEGEILGTLTVESNAPTSPTAIPITATVQTLEPESQPEPNPQPEPEQQPEPEPEPSPEPQSELRPTIGVTPSSIDFGEMTVDQTTSITISIDNTGDADLDVTNITSDLGEILTFSSTTFTVAAGTTHPITLTLTAIAAGEIFGTLNVESNAPTSPTTIPIAGVISEIDGSDRVSTGSPSPTIANIFPENVPPQGNVLLGIWGDDFVTEMTVFIGDQPAEILAFSENYVGVLVPAGMGTVDIIITAPTGETVRLEGGITYDAEIPCWDVNEDGSVDIFDLVAVASHFGESTIPAAMSAMGLSMSNRDQLLRLLTTLEGIENPTHGTHILIDFLHSLLGPNPIVAETKVLANYPNPFNPETWIPYQLAVKTDVEISIYSADGYRVRTLQLGIQPGGEYVTRDKAAYWDGRSDVGEQVSSGVYFYHFRAGDYSATQKMTVVK